MEKPKFNFIDGLIIFVLVLVIAAGSYLIFARQNQTSTNSNGVSVAEYKVQLTQVEPKVGELFEDALENGEKVLVTEKEKIEATLMDVLIEPARELLTDNIRKEERWAEFPDLCDVTVTLRSEVSENDTQINAGTTPLRVGERLAVKGRGFAGQGFIIGLDIVD